MTKAISRLKVGAAVTAALVLTTLPAAGQDSPLPELFSDSVDVRIVNVEVVVTDRKGNRIRGLQPDDFELLVDRQSVPIAYFTEVDEGYARTAADGIANAQSLARNEQVGTNYLIFVDDLSAIRGRRNRVLSRLDQDLRVLNPADRAAIVAFDGKGVSRLTNWTNSRYQLRSALLEAQMRPAFGRRGSEATRRAVLAATATMQSVARGPGRNVMLLLADSWSAPSAVWDVLGSGLSRPNIESLYSPLVHAANRLGYSLYPVDVAGMQYRPDSYGRIAPSPPGGYYAYGTADSRGSTIYPPPWPSMQSVMAGSYEQRQHDVLRFLANETGGRAMLNAFRSKAFSETVADTRSYYWLGFDARRAGTTSSTTSGCGWLGTGNSACGPASTTWTCRRTRKSPCAWRPRCSLATPPAPKPWTYASERPGRPDSAGSPYRWRSSSRSTNWDFCRWTDNG